MKWRSEACLGEADRFLRAAQVLLEAGLPQNAVGEAYYAAYWAARAALSEEDREARRHSGTWSLFDQYFTRTGRFPRDLRSAARGLEDLRNQSDYRINGADHEQAQRAVVTANEFVTAVREMLADA